MEWLVKQCEAVSWRALAPEAVTIVEVSIPVHIKGKRKIVDHMEKEKSCKFLSRSTYGEIIFGFRGEEETM